MVLLIDDHPSLLEGMQALLEACGYTTVATRRGEEGIRLAREQRPRVVLCNFHMPDVDGLSVLYSLKRDPDTSSIPFVFVSAEDQQTIRKQCTEFEADAVVHKSEIGDELFRIVERLAGRGRVMSGS